MTSSPRTVIRPSLLLDVVTGDLLPDRAAVIEDNRIAGVAAAGDAPGEGAVVVDRDGCAAPAAGHRQPYTGRGRAVTGLRTGYPGISGKLSRSGEILNCA